MATHLDAKLLRNAAPPAQAAYFRTLCSRPDIDTLAATDELIGLIASGALRPIVMCPWLSISRDPRAINVVLRQPHSEYARHVAIKLLKRRLRREETFAQTWAALGGSAGLVETMSQLSARDVRRLCKELGRTSGGFGSMHERERALSELYNGLKRRRAADDGSLSDARPLEFCYDELLPGCTTEKVLEWTDEQQKDTQFSLQKAPKKLHTFHGAALEQLAVDQCFKREGHIELSKVRPLLKNNWSLGMKVLAGLAESRGHQGLRGQEFMSDLAIPLVKRFQSRRNDVKGHLMTWNLVIKCLEKHPALREGSWGMYRRGDSKSGLIYHLMRLWRPSLRRPNDEAIFKKIVGLVPAEAAANLAPEKLMGMAAPHHRYLVLSLFFRYAVAYGCDIGPDTSTDVLPFKNKDALCSTQTFLLLPPHQALNLLHRCIQSRPGDYSLSYKQNLAPHSVTEQRVSPDVYNFDLDILQAVLIRKMKPADLVGRPDLIATLHRLRTSVLPEQKKRAVKDKSAEGRAFWAVAACNLSIAVGDLDLYAETLLWARRYTKDYLVVRALHEQRALQTSEGLELLSVVPEKGHHIRASKNNIAEQIEKANKIMLLLVENASLALDEPSFHQRDTTAVFETAKMVIVRRLQRFHVLQDHFELPDAAAFDFLLQPTLDTLMAIEVVARKPGNERLSMNGPYSLVSPHHIVQKFRQPVFNFVDRYMEACNNLWASLRPVEDALASVPRGTPWPEGLPVKYLWRNREYGGRSMPYIESRAEAVVFWSPDETLIPPPEDVSKRRRDIESWPSALKIYLCGADEHDTRASRIWRVWNHAFHSLTGGRMSTSEASYFWVVQFQKAGVEDSEMTWATDKFPKQRIAELPIGEDPTAAHEWNPDPNSASTSRTLSRTVLDYAMSVDSFSDGIGVESFSVKNGPELGAFWDLRSESHVDPFIAASLLTIESEYGLGTSILATPFPNEQNPRFPAMYLDQEFLESSSNNNPNSAFFVLEQFPGHVPPQLLANLAESMLKKMKADPQNSRRSRSEVVRILKILSRSDCPSMAGNLVQRFILEFPNASAWHRGLVGQNFLCGLSSPEAREFLQSFSDAMLQMLQQQEDVKQQRAPAGDVSVTDAPLIKVTTLKLLAQLLQPSPFVDKNVSIQILMDLARKATHFDVRVQAFDSLISAVTYKMDPVPKARTYEMLSNYAVHAAGSMNEQEPDINWAAFEADETLPEVSLDDGTERPILEMLFDKSELRSIHDGDDVAEVFRLMVESSLRLSMENNHRWQALFMKQHGLSLANGKDLPKIPASPGAILRFKEPARDLFEATRCHVLTNLSPPPELVAFNKSVKKNVQLRNSNAGKYWLSLWDCPGTASLSLGGSWVAKNLGSSKSDEWNATLDAFFLELVDVVLAQANLMAFDSLIRSIRHPYKPAILPRIIDRIDAIRTNAWQTDPNRTPEYLPKTFKLRLQLLSSENKTLKAETVHLHVDKLLALMEPLLSSGVPCDEELKELTQHTVACKGHLLEMAISLGSLGPHGSLEKFADPVYAPSRLDYQRVEMSLHLIKKADTGAFKKPQVVEPLKAMVWAWRKSRDEYFRDCARAANEPAWKNGRRVDRFNLFA